MELDELYQEIIIDHGTEPRNFCVLDNATHSADGLNPMCGDKLKVYLKVAPDKTIEKVTFMGQGCAISTASASIMTEILPGKTIEQAKELFKLFQALVTSEQTADEKLGKLAALAGVKAYPARVKCATLAWHALDLALKGENKPATTE